MSDPGKTTEGLAQAVADVNPIKSDPELQMLLKNLEEVKDYKNFQKWKASFSSRLELALYEEEGMVPAEQSCTGFSKLLKRTMKRLEKVHGLMEKGDLGENKQTVKATLALNEMCNSLTSAIQAIELLLPYNLSVEKKLGFTKFHVGAVLVRQGFHQYDSMQAIEDALQDIGGKLENIADRQQHELFASYVIQVQRFRGVMADVGLNEVVANCREFSEPPVTIQISVEDSNGKIIQLDLEATETIDSIKEAIAIDCGIEADRQVLKFGGENMDDNNKTLEELGIQDGSELSVEPFDVPVTVNTMDGTQIQLMVEQTGSLSDIKLLLENESGLPAKNQNLFMNGDELGDDSETAADCGIGAGSVLDLEPKLIQVSVETPDGKQHSVDVKPSDTSDIIKQNIEEETGRAAAWQVLKFNAEELPNGETVKDMGIREGSELKVEINKVPVTVTTMDGTQIQLTVDPTGSLSDLKCLLENESGLKASNQTLLMNGDVLGDGDDSKAVTDCGIGAGSELEVEPAVILITIETPDRTLNVEVYPSITSDMIQLQIEKVTGLSAARQVCKFNGVKLPKGATVKAMGLRDGSELKVEIYKISVTVNTMDGTQIQLIVDPSDFLYDMKMLLVSESGLTAKNQNLFINGDELGDNIKTITDCGIGAGSVLDLEPKSFEISVKTPDGKKYLVDVKPSDTSDMLKQIIEEETDIAAPRQVLKFNAEELSNGETAKAMGIRDGSKLKVEINKVPVTVNTMDGFQIQLMVEPTSSLSDLKCLLENESGLPAKNQTLFMNGDELGDDSETVTDCGIGAGSVLNLEPKSIQISVEALGGKQQCQRSELDASLDPLGSEGDWTAHLDEDTTGLIYYFNGITGESLWEPPTKSFPKVSLEAPVKRLAFDVKPSDTSDIIKQKIEEETGMATSRQVLKFNAEELPVGKTVKDMGIRDGSELKVECERELNLEDNLLDHIVLAAPDLDQAMQDFKKMAGVELTLAGAIRGLGIRCARVSFDDSSYIEVIAPDPNSPGPIGEILKGMVLEGMVPFHYAIRSAKAKELKEKVKKFGYTPDHICMSGKHKDGTSRKWEMLYLYGHEMGGICPFFINHANSDHPCRRLPVVGTLKRFTIRAPEGDPVHELFPAIGVNTILLETGKPKISFRFSSPEGTVKFSSSNPAGFVFP
jgi:hypothetical protein